MNTTKNETSVQLKRAHQRYIMIDENIHASLDQYSLQLYMTFRFEADFREEDSCIKRSAKFLYEKSKISRAQFYRCLNKLEDFGVILRDKNNGLGQTSVYHVARELYYFNSSCRGVSGEDGGVSGRDTDHYPFSLNDIISVSEENADNDSKKEKEVTSEAIVAVYHEVLPDSPEIRVIDKKLNNQLRDMKKNWSKYSATKQKFSLEGFRKFLLAIKETQPGFLDPYPTGEGNIKQNNLRVITTEKNIAKLINGEFNFKQRKHVNY